MSIFGSMSLTRKVIEGLRVCTHAFAAACDYEIIAHRIGKQERARAAFSLLTNRLTQANAQELPSCESRDADRTLRMQLRAEH